MIGTFVISVDSLSAVRAGSIDVFKLSIYVRKLSICARQLPIDVSGAAIDVLPKASLQDACLKNEKAIASARAFYNGRSLFCKENAKYASVSVFIIIPSIPKLPKGFHAIYFHRA